jgi:hypothetical protein
VKKVELPTYFETQPTVIFGRTGREIIIILCGIALGYYMWSCITSETIAATALRIFLMAIPIVTSVLVSLISIGERPLEEWALILLFYAFTPKFYQHTPFDWEEESQANEQMVLAEQAPGSKRDDKEEAASGTIKKNRMD